MVGGRKMKRNERRKRIMPVILAVAICITSMLVMEPAETSAATTYIKPEEFIRALVKELDLPVDSSNVDAAIKAGIVKDGEEFSSNLTRTEAAVLLNRADEYLYGDTLDPKLLELTLEKRISDIQSIEEDKRLDVVKCYLKGFIKGYSNGKYSTDRKFKGNSKMSYNGALKCIAMLKDKSLRAKISLDGQLIRTTNLPKNAELFPYILASYPNKYYEWELKYQTIARLNKDKKITNLVDYASPKNIDNLNVSDYEKFSLIKKECINEWMEKAKKHLELVFNVNYRTIDNEWYDSILKTNYQYGTVYEWLPRKKLDWYIEMMKQNKTIVEADKIAVDGSSLYYYNDSFYMRVYVKYRVISSEDLSVPDGNTPGDKWSYDKVLFSYGFNDLGKKITLGEWREEYYNIVLGDYSTEGDLGIQYVEFLPGKELD